MEKTQGEMARELAQLIEGEAPILDIDLLDAMATLGYKLVESPDDEVAQDYVIGIIVEAAKDEPHPR